MAKDVCIGNTIVLFGHKSTVVDLYEYDGIEYAKLSYRSILVPLTAIWRERDDSLTVT